MSPSAAELLENLERLTLLRGLETWLWVIALVIAVLTATRLPKARVRSWPGWLLAAALLVVLVNRVVVRQIPSALRQVGDYETAEVAALASFWCAHVRRCF